MILRTATAKAMRYACKHFHYSRTMPAVCYGYSVFNSNDEWCGCIIYGYGANPNIAKMFGLLQGEAMELVRVALNGKQEKTSQAVALSLRLLKKDCPLVKVVVSYADTEQGHVGTIYQACNWYYLGETKAEKCYLVGEKKIHRRTMYQKSTENVRTILCKPKHKYVYPLSRGMREWCEKHKKPYPKQV